MRQPGVADSKSLVPASAQAPMGAQGQTEEPKPEPKTDSLGAEQQSGKRISAPRQRANEATSV